MSSHVSGPAQAADVHRALALALLSEEPDLAGTSSKRFPALGSATQNALSVIEKIDAFTAARFAEQLQRKRFKACIARMPRSSRVITQLGYSAEMERALSRAQAVNSKDLYPYSLWAINWFKETVLHHMSSIVPDWCRDLVRYEADLMELRILARDFAERGDSWREAPVERFMADDAWAVGERLLMRETTRLGEYDYEVVALHRQAKDGLPASPHRSVQRLLITAEGEDIGCLSLSELMYAFVRALSEGQNVQQAAVPARFTVSEGLTIARHLIGKAAFKVDTGSGK